MGAETRRQHRLAVALEVRIRGTDRAGRPFEETTSSSNVSRGGCSLEISRELEPGAELEIEILRRIPGRVEPSLFLTRGGVLRSVPVGEGHYTTAIHFTGPHFPTYASEDTTAGGA